MQRMWLCLDGWSLSLEMIMNEADSLFRKSSLDRVRTPEQLNEAVKGTGTGFTVLLIALAVLVTGLVLWGAFGTIEETAAASGIVSGDTIILTVPADAVSGITAGIDARIENRDTVIRGRVESLEQSADGFTATVTYDGILTDGASVTVILVKSAYPPYRLIWR